MQIKPSYLKIGIGLVLLLFTPIANAQQRTVQLQKINEWIATAKSNSLKDTLLTKKLLNDAISSSLQLKNDTSLAKAYEVYGIMYARRGFNKEAFSFFKKQLEVSIASNNDYYIGVAQSNLSNVLSELGDNKGSIKASLQALKLFQKIKNEGKQGDVLMNLGITYISMGDYQTAMQYQLEALKIREKLKNKNDLAYSQHALAVLYSRMKNNSKALAYNYEALKTFRELNDEATSSNILFNIAIINIRLKHYDEAKSEIESIIPYFKRLNKAESLRKCYIQLSNIADLLGNDKESEKYLDLALQYATLNGSATNDVNVLINRSRLHLLQKRYLESEQDLLLAQEIATKSSDYFNIINVKRQFLTLYQESGQAKKANAMLIQYDQLKDSILNETNILKLNELQTKYETAQKENQIAILDRENHINALKLKNNNFLLNQQQQLLTINRLALQNKDQLVKNQHLDAEQKAQHIKSLKKQAKIQELELSNKKLEIRKRNLLIGSILILFLTVGLISFLFYNRYRLKQANLLQAEIFRQQEIANQSLFEGEQKERIRIARDLHDSIGQMLSVVKMNISTFGDLGTKNAIVENAAVLIDKTIEEVRHISHNLIPEELNFGLFSAIENLCEKISSSHKIKATFSIPENIRRYKFEKQNELGIYRIIQEVMNNMVRHAGATEININVLRRNYLMIIHIKDNGKGFDTTDIVNSKGIGWKNIAARVNMLNGKLAVTSALLTGTEIEISIPEWNKQEIASIS